jgi:hypothetical protein
MHSGRGSQGHQHGKEEPSREFWVTTMIKDCKVNTGGDSASAVLYQKWHVLAPNFITDLSEGRFSLEGGMVDHLATAGTQERLESSSARASDDHGRSGLRARTQLRWLIL